MSSLDRLQHLFDRWFTLEPDSAKACGIDQHNIAAMLAAIVDHNLRVQLENASDGWHVVLLHPDEVGAAVQSHSPDPAIALLAAYVNWLERQAAKENEGDA